MKSETVVNASRVLFRAVEILAAALGLVLLFSITSLSQEAVLELDPAQTQIQFTLGATFHTVHGTFKLKRGTIRYNPNDGKASGLVVVDVTSGESGNDGRDLKMHKDVLQSSKYPEATFAPAQIRGGLDPKVDSQIEIQGVFNLLGGHHDLTLTFRVHKAGDHLTASTHFVIPYQQWGLKNPSTLFLRVSDKVNIDIQAVGRLTWPAGH
ncbi:MAG TPA: YceI family protein [Terriglobia bacterium]|nr:YceI family protein [Terriglobia bacterium]